MEAIDHEIKEREAKFFEVLEDILATDLSNRAKMLKIQSELNFANLNIKNAVENYQIEYHFNELPF